MSWVFYWQRTGEDAWIVADSAHRKEIETEKRPAFTTILDLMPEIQEEATKEELYAVQYRGPAYFDFDSDDIEECIPQFNKFLTKLVDLGIDLRQVQLYASGGKGFHVVVPQKLFIPKPNSAGYQHLPQTYKEMAQALYVDCLDMRVYSARKGRMFRTVNVLRKNGNYKVQLTVAEARSMTAELYEEICAAERPTFEPEEPKLNQELARIFSDSRERVTKAIESRKNSKANEDLVKQFKGAFPESVLMLGRGENINPDVGFHQLATQIAITATALGLTEAQMLEASKGLVETHQSDGYRYNTPVKRRKELLRMYHYMSDNPCYEFSAGAVKSCLVKGTPTPDLNPPIEDPLGALDEDDELDLDDDLTKGVRFNINGIFLKLWNKDTKTHYVKRVAEVGITEVSLLQDMQTRENIGFEYSAWMGGNFRGRRKVSIAHISSANSLQAAIGNPESAGIQINDAQAKAFLDLMRKKAEANNAVVTRIPREGVDLIPLPDTKTETDRMDIVYAGPRNIGVVTKKGETKNYLLETVNGIDGEFKSDLLSAPILKGTPKETEFLDKFFGLHPKDVMSRTLGFYIACFMTQIIRREFNQFPVLQVFGPAGVGKTAFNTLCSNLHFYNKQPQVWAANDVTPFALTTMLQSSASIPVVFDELKTRELGIRRSQEFLMIIRNNYTGNQGGKGRVSRESGPSTLSVNKQANVAPLVFLAEELETQTAVMDRSVQVAMGDKKIESDDFNYCLRNRRVLGGLGHLIVRKVLDINLEAFRNQLEEYRQQITENSQGKATSRPAHNNAVILTGLEFGRMVLEGVYGDRYNAIFEALKDEILINITKSLPDNKAEATKVLDTMAYLTSRGEHDPLRLILGVDYGLAFDKVTKEPCVDIHLRNAWDKYTRYRRSQGEQPLYASEGAFVNAMKRHRAAFDTVCTDSELKGGRPSVQVVRFSLRILYEEEQVEEFSQLEESKL